MMRLLENQNQLLKKYTKNNFYKFLITGSLNTIFTYMIYLLLLIVIKYTYAYSISFVCGIVFSYIMNLKYVFSVSHSRKKILIYDNASIKTAEFIFNKSEYEPPNPFGVTTFPKSSFEVWYSGNSPNLLLDIVATGKSTPGEQYCLSSLPLSFQV